MISLPDMSRFIDFCRSSDLIILYLEGFRSVSGGIVPEMSAIADFSSLTALPWDEATPKSWESASAFVSQMQDQRLMFDIGVYSRAEIFGIT